MKEDLTYITALVLLCREHPHLLQRLCRMMGCFSKVVSLDGLPSDQRDNRKHSNFSRHDAAWLHSELDRELDHQNRTVKGFLVFLVENKRLWEAMTLLD